MGEYYGVAENLTSGELLREAVQALRGASHSAALDAQVLLAHALGIQRARLLSHPEESRSPSERLEYRGLIARRAAGEPLAYIVGYKEFWSLRLGVSPAVLVPRPETELLVEHALALGATRSACADLGTGCGAIALALAHERPAWQVTATGASSAALEVARSNATALGLMRIEFLLGEWYAPLAGRRFDLIVSNPPYLAAAEPALALPPLNYEPRSALTPGADGLCGLVQIIREAREHLAPGGWLLLEHGADQAGDVARELVVRGMRHVRSHRDLAGQERMTQGQWGERPATEGICNS